MEASKKKAINITIISVCIALSVIMVFFVSSAFLVKPSEKNFEYQIIMPNSVPLGKEAHVVVRVKNKTFFMLAFRGEDLCKIVIINREIDEDGAPSEGQLGGKPAHFGMIMMKGTLEHSWQMDTQKRGQYLIEVEISFNLNGKDYSYSANKTYTVY